MANPPLALGQDTVVDEPALIAELIGQLNSDSYARRSAATERLAGLGQPAVAPLTKAVMAGNLETATRGIYILRNLAVEAEDDTISQAALESLKQIANTKDNVHSQVAIKTLGQLGVLQQQRAIKVLQEKGAEFGQRAIRINENLVMPFRTIWFGPEWTGNLEDLEELKWVVDSPYSVDERFDAVAIGVDPNKWCVLLEGENVTDQWLAKLGKGRQLQALVLRHTKTTDEGIALLANLVDLRYLQIRHTPFSDASTKHFAKIASLIRLELYGTEITDEASQQLKQQLPAVDVDYRKGAMLGITCNRQPCSISMVYAGSAADKAGLRVGDTIVKFADAAIFSFADLTEQISKYSPGQQVIVAIERNGKTEEHEVLLGEWIEP
ncbi:MAG: PDZ domain-containing protein, partial [Planctomycetales bacterium]|nr:PDZ domain-containing protein [Planctomycetales bacterium]